MERATVKLPKGELWIDNRENLDRFVEILVTIMSKKNVETIITEIGEDDHYFTITLVIKAECLIIFEDYLRRVDLSLYTKVWLLSTNPISAVEMTNDDVVIDKILFYVPYRIENDTIVRKMNQMDFIRRKEEIEIRVSEMEDSHFSCPSVDYMGATEILEEFNLEQVYADDYDVYKFRDVTKPAYKIDVAEALCRIRGNMLPLVHFGGNWQNQRYSDNTVIKLSCIIESVFPFCSFTVFPDLSVMCEFSCSDEVVQLSSLLEKWENVEFSETSSKPTGYNNVFKYRNKYYTYEIKGEERPQVKETTFQGTLKTSKIDSCGNVIFLPLTRNRWGNCYHERYGRESLLGSHNA